MDFFVLLKMACSNAEDNRGFDLHLVGRWSWDGHVQFRCVLTWLLTFRLEMLQALGNLLGKMRWHCRLIHGITAKDDSLWQFHSYLCNGSSLSLRPRRHGRLFPRRRPPGCPPPRCHCSGLILILGCPYPHYYCMKTAISFIIPGCSTSRYCALCLRQRIQRPSGNPQHGVSLLSISFF